MTDRYEKIRAVLAHEIRAAARLAPGEGIVDDGVARIVALLRNMPHPAITHCDNCGCDWLDNGLNPIGCPYCELRQETERDEALLRQALDALIWTTGSEDFSEGGLAREGALKLLFPTITALRERLGEGANHD